MSFQAPNAKALSVLPPTFEQLVEGAGQILRIEVTAMESRRDDVAGRRVIHTYVSCQVLRTLKGASGETITLRFFGGRIGGERLEVPEMPLFEVGKKYIVFLRNNGKAFCPVLAATHGHYPLEIEEATGTEHVMRSNRTPLVALAEVTRPITSAGTASDVRMTAAAGLTRDAFEAGILNQLSHASQK